MNFTRSSLRGLLFFLINPLIGLVFGLFNYRKDWAKNVVWGISVFYGLSFVVDPDSSSDSFYYASRLKDMHDENWNFIAVFGSFYLADGALDIYQPFVSFVVSKFTDNYNILFGIFGLVFGYFYSRNIWIILNESNSRMSLIQVLVMLVFAFVISIATGINGVRMYTAAQVFIYGVLVYFIRSNKFGLFFILVSFLFHWSFLMPIFILLVFNVAKRFLSLGVLVYAFFITFVLSISNVSFVGGGIQGLIPVEGIQSKSMVYLDSEYIEKVSNTEVSFFLTLNSLLIDGYFVVSLLYFYFVYGGRFQKFKYNNFFLFVVFFGCFANILKLVPSGGRFVAVAQILFLAFILLYTFKVNDFKFLRLQQLAFPVLIFFLIVQLRFFINYIDFSFFYGNVILNNFLERGTPIGLRF